MAIKGGISALRRTGGYVAIASALLLAAPVHSQIRAPQPIHFDIPAGSLQSALTVFARQAGLELIYAPEAVAGRQVARLHVSLSARAALERLLANSGLRIRQVNAKVIVLERNSAHAGASGDASALTATASQVGESLPAQAGSDQEPPQDIIVTGTNIRGEPPIGSHVRTITRRQIDENGYSSVGQVLQSLPGNFGGVATEQSSLSFVDHTGTNATLSTGVNLRGLGADATLVLINGHRLAGAGNLGDFADVSDIPLSAVDRIEVLMDGASAIYGSDAVGGVVNVIMKDHFQGLETGGRFGTVTSGNMRDLQAYATAGTSWASGNILLSYEFDDRTPLLAKDRRFSRSADSRPLGGTDHRTIYSLPGNILGFDPVTGALEPTYAIPTGQDGKTLQPGDFIAGQINYGDPLEGAYLTPRQVRHSLYAAVHQDLADGVRFSLEGRYTHRDFTALTGGYVTVLTITDANPWFVSPTGQSSDLIAYDFTQELGPTREYGWSETMGFTGALDARLGHGWKLSGYAAYGRSNERQMTDHIANEAILSEALGTTGDDPATAYNPSRDGYFNPYGDGSANAPAVLAAVGSGYLDARNIDDIVTGNLQADGPLFDLPAGAVRVAIGANIRREVFESDYTSFYVTTTPSADDPVHYGRTIKAAFAEARIPLFGDKNALPGLRRLDLSVAGRIERYPDFGTTANPKIGLDWSPFDGLTFRGTYGTSFRAPNLSELRSPVAVVTTTLKNASGASLLVLYLGGGNPGLQPEKARSWTLGADIRPRAVPGLHLGATLFRTIFDQRIDRPVAQDLADALVNPDLASFVRFVSPATNPGDDDYVSSLVADFANGNTTFPVDRIAAVVDARYVNTASNDVRGIDMTIGYTAKAGTDTFSLDGSATYLLAWRQRTTPTSTSIDERNRSSEPAAFRGRFTASWRRGGLDTLIGLNYVNAYRDAITGAPINSWITVDARIAWTAPKNSWIGGTTFALVAQNLFDRDPPFYDSAAGVGYDAANSDATGRFVSFQIDKRW